MLVKRGCYKSPGLEMKTYENQQVLRRCASDFSKNGSHDRLSIPRPSVSTHINIINAFGRIRETWEKSEGGGKEAEMMQNAVLMNETLLKLKKINPTMKEKRTSGKGTIPVPKDLKIWKKRFCWIFYSIYGIVGWCLL